MRLQRGSNGAPVALELRSATLRRFPFYLPSEFVRLSVRLFADGTSGMLVEDA